MKKKHKNNKTGQRECDKRGYQGMASSVFFLKLFNFSVLNSMWGQSRHLTLRRPYIVCCGVNGVSLLEETKAKTIESDDLDTHRVEFARVRRSDSVLCFLFSCFSLNRHRRLKLMEQRLNWT